MPSRKGFSRRGRGFRPKFPSRKLNRMIPCESIPESKVALLFEYSRGVKSYREQPALILYPDGDRIRRYYPDFEVITANDVVIHIEVKPADRLRKPETAEKFRAIAAYYLSQGRLFRILTEQEFEREPLHSNLKTLHRLVCQGQVPDSILRSVTTCLRLGSLPADALGVELHHLWRLVGQGVLHCDLEQLLSGTTLLSLSGGRDDAALLF